MKLATAAGARVAAQRWCCDWAPRLPAPSRQPSAETAALAGEQRARLASAVGRLREDDQLVIAARYFLGLSEAETAIALGLRRGTVKSRLSRALGRLQTGLEASE
jgi:RNA polymerase sigma factor (sigma-70 family)